MEVSRQVHHLYLVDGTNYRLTDDVPTIISAGHKYLTVSFCQYQGQSQKVTIDHVHLKVLCMHGIMYMYVLCMYYVSNHCWQSFRQYLISAALYSQKH